MVSSLTMGTLTFGGKGASGKVGDTDVAGAGWQTNLCVEAGVNLIEIAATTY